MFSSSDVLVYNSSAQTAHVASGCHVKQTELEHVHHCCSFCTAGSYKGCA